MSDFKKEYELWDEFLRVWPLARLATMTLDDYTQAGSKDSFTYWIESRLDELGSIWGGSSFKFGVFSRKDTDDKTSDAASYLIPTAGIPRWALAESLHAGTWAVTGGSLAAQVISTARKPEHLAKLPSGRSPSIIRIVNRPSS
jgi:5-methylcytosine-specific restriction protein B